MKVITEKHEFELCGEIVVITYFWIPPEPEIIESVLNYPELIVVGTERSGR